VVAVSDSDGDIARAYEQTSFEMVATGADDKYELPVSEGAKYRLPERERASNLQSGLERGNYSFIAPYKDGDYYLSSKVLDHETNEFMHLKLTGEILHIYPKDEEFSKETLKRVVSAIEKHVTQLRWVDKDE